MNKSKAVPYMPVSVAEPASFWAAPSLSFLAVAILAPATTKI